MLLSKNFLEMKILCYLLLLHVRHAFSQKTYPWSSVKQETKLMCKTKECEEIGEMYKRNLDRRKNPCTDFYEYACGNWEMVHPVPPDADEWGARAVQQEATAHKVKALLKNEAKHTKLGQTYSACTKIPALGQLTIDQLMIYVETIDVWPTFGTKVKSARQPWWAIDSYYISQTGESAFFDIKMAYDHEERSLPLFQLKPLLSVYGRIVRLRAWESADIQPYLEFLKSLIDACSHYKTTGRAKVSVKDISDVITFRLELKSIGTQPSKNSKHTVRTTIKDLQRMFDKKRVKSRTTVLIDWLEIMRSVYKNNSPERINMETDVNVRNYEYFVSLAKLLDNTPEDIIVNHIHLYFLERHLLLDATWRTKLNKAIYSEHPCLEKKGRIRRIHERWVTCIFNFRAVFDFNKLFIGKYLTPEAKKTVESIMPEIKSLLSSEILDSDWLHSAAKDKSISKVRDVQAWIGYPIWYDNPKLKEKFKKMEITPIEANACEIPEYNTVYLTTAIFSPPMGCTSDAYPVTYATVGFALAHVFYHGFNTVGITYDGKGKKNISWWSTHMRHKYDAQKKCFMDQYQQFLMKDLNIRDAKQCDVSEAYDENMSDIMGLKLAYQLYRKTLYEKQGTCYVPPHIKEFTCDQLFFIAYANTQCSLVKSHSMEYGTIGHSSPRYRVNGPLMNMEEFSKAFHCKSMDSMQLPAASRCDLWMTARH